MRYKGEKHMTDEELLQQALDALISVWNMDKTTKQVETIQAIKARLTQPEPDPQEIIAKWIKANTEHREWYICPKCSHQTPRWKDEWVGLTDEEIIDIWAGVSTGYDDEINIVHLGKAIKEKLKEKNGS